MNKPTVRMIKLEKKLELKRARDAFYDLKRKLDEEEEKGEENAVDPTE